MKTDAIEDAIVAAAIAHGWKPTSEAMTAAAVHLAGSAVVDGLIVIPNKGAISPADFVRDLQGRMPNAFASLADERKAETTTGNLTEQMRHEIAATRRQRALPSDWLAVRSKATGITAQHMAERERNWK